MRKFFVLLLFGFSLACSKQNETQSEELVFKKAPQSLIDKLYLAKNENHFVKNRVAEGPCDNAVSIGVKVETDFELKRPKYNCQRGFWFCTSTTTYGYCSDANGNVIYQAPVDEFFNASRTNMPESYPDLKYYAELYEVGNDEIILSFSKEYFINGNYIQSDLDYFWVDDNREVLPEKYLIKGKYEVFEHEDNLLILLPIN
uniref:hypothetical protein n=1 Tax=Gelidibacter sp. TaxID=2018083 RepID=UPI00404A0B62